MPSIKSSVVKFAILVTALATGILFCHFPVIVSYAKTSLFDKVLNATSNRSLILASCRFANTLAFVKYLFTEPSGMVSVVPEAADTASMLALIVPATQSITIVGSAAVRAVLALVFV